MVVNGCLPLRVHPLHEVLAHEVEANDQADRAENNSWEHVSRQPRVRLALRWVDCWLIGQEAGIWTHNRDWLYIRWSQGLLACCIDYLCCCGVVLVAHPLIEQVLQF